MDLLSVVDRVCVSCEISHVSFSAHADSKGIVQLIRQCAPRNVMLVHGDKHKMGFLKQKVRVHHVYAGT